MEKIKLNLYLFFKIMICIYIVVFLFTNMTMLFFTDKLIKFSIIKFDSIFENASTENLSKLENILSKYSIEINYDSK